jgi:hypothetical protein
MLKFALRISFVLNIVLILLALSQREKIRQLLADDDEESAALDGVLVHAREARESLHLQELRTIASSDQLEAFVEEYTGYGETD